MPPTTLRPALALLFLALLTPAVTRHHVADARQQSPFLKEILMGRCFDRYPFATASSSPHDGDVDGSSSSSSSSSRSQKSSCDAIVGSFMNVLEGHLDDDISATDFDQSYADQANFSSPRDASMLWLPFRRDDDEGNRKHFFRPPQNLVTPEDTPGGRLLRDLTFCGAGVPADACRTEGSNAWGQFWSAAYGRFASQVVGSLHIVVEGVPRADVQFLQGAVLARLQVGHVTSVQVWAGDCTAPAVTATMGYLANGLKVPPSGLSCNEDLHELELCHDDPDGDPCVSYKRGQVAKAAGERHANCTFTGTIDSIDPNDADLISGSSESSTPSRRIRHYWLVRFLLWSSLTGCICWGCSRRAGDYLPPIESSSGSGRVGIRKSLLGTEHDVERDRHPIPTYSPRNHGGGDAESFFLGGAQTSRGDDIRAISQ